MQKCWDCKQVKPWESFGKYKSRKTGYNTLCKECNSKRTRLYQVELRDRVAQMKLDVGCADCGYKEHPEALGFDHLPGFIKTANVSKLVQKNATWEKIQLEIEKCQVVCNNCHAVRTYNRRSSSKD